MRKSFIYLVLFLLSVVNSFSQRIPVGMPVFDEYLRRLQLTGQVDSTSSWMIRPILPTEAFGWSTGYDRDSLVVNELNFSSSYDKFGKNGKGKFLVLPGIYRAQFNSEYAFGVNDGVMIPNRGLQQVFSIGAFAEYGKFSLQFQPELLFAQNKSFLGFPIEHQSNILFYYEYMNRIDMPERFGDQPIKSLYPGQSSFRFN
ncbi:MAG: hypothetical protein O9252_00565, partial [Algoriphagus sp.]|nr:hypothetical protein [Algoriphagus sp.]